MKKLVLLLSLFAMTVFTSIAQVKIDSTQMDVKIDPQMVQDGKEVLSKIVIGAGDTMKTGYEIVVKQQYVYAIQYLLVGVLSFIMFCGFIYFYLGVTNEKMNRIFPALICFGLFLWSAISFSGHFDQIIQAFVNPEYAAIKDIVEMTKNIVSK